MVTIHIKAGFLRGRVIHNHDMHITIEDRCSTLTLDCREKIVGNAKYSRTEYTLSIPLIQLNCKGIVSCYRR